MFLTTNYFFCEQIANFWVFFDFYSLFQFLANPYFMGYLPQHCLYFLPLPHARPLTIFCLYMVQIVLCVFPLFYGHLVHYIISIIYIINITNFICYVDKMWTRIIFSQHFVSSFIISQNKILENKSTSLYNYVIFLWYHIY